MAALLVRTVPTPVYEVGDIIHAWPDLLIAYTWAQAIKNQLNDDYLNNYWKWLNLHRGPNEKAVDDFWKAIESASEFKRADYWKPPVGKMELSGNTLIYVTEFDMSTAAELCEPQVDHEGEVYRMRRRYVDMNKVSLPPEAFDKNGAYMTNPYQPYDLKQIINDRGVNLW